MTLDDFAIAATTSNLSQEPIAREYADFIDFRLYHADSPMTQLTNYDGPTPLIISGCGSVDTNDHSDRESILSEIADLETVSKMDLSLGFASNNGTILEIINENTELIISYENQHETPDKDSLRDIAMDCDQLGDMIKLSTFAKTKSDCLTILELVNEISESGKDIVGIATGDIGRHTRITAPFYGSQIGYAPIHVDTDVQNSGQIELEEFATSLEAVDRGADHVTMIQSLEQRFESGS